MSTLFIGIPCAIWVEFHGLLWVINSVSSYTILTMVSNPYETSPDTIIILLCLGGNQDSDF